ncbi:MAG TPA: nuclear transport factor 2 family protein [Saprospiraceae bacterium]|nr:nuclear transport factor 2 family protein [Saprospiraceae bacterium]
MKPVKSWAWTAFFSLFVMAGAYAGKVEDNIRAAYDALNRRDYTTFLKYVTPDFTEYSAGPEPIKTPQAAIEAYKMYFAGMPDLKFTIQDIGKGTEGRYYVSVMITGTNSGSFMSMPPTGKKFEMSDVDILTINDKKLATSHRSSNPNGILTSIGYGSITNPNTGLIMSLYEKFGKHDMDGIMASTSDQAVWEVDDDRLYVEPRTFKGKAEIGQFFKDLDSKQTYTKFQPVQFIADGDDVVVMLDVEFTTKPTGLKYVSHYIHHFKVMNGKVTWFKGVADIQLPSGK